MLRLTRYLFLFVASLFAAFGQDAETESAFTPLPSRLAEGVGEGFVSLDPYQLGPAVVGDYALTFVVGSSGIKAGGGILVDFPKSWFTNPTPLVKPMQTTSPDGFHYIGATTSRETAKLSVEIDHANFDGKTERFRHMIMVRVSGAPLEKYDTVTVTLAHTTSPYLVGDDAVQAAVDRDATGQFKRLASEADYTVAAGPASDARAFMPSIVVKGATVPIHLTVFDRFANVAARYGGEATLDGLGSSPIQIQLKESDGGRASAEWLAGDPGTYYPVLRLPIEGRTLEVACGPIEVLEAAPAESIYWGDLHSHSRISKDGIGFGDYAYARDAVHLDFFASTEHDVSDAAGDSITPSEWDFIKSEVTSYYAPGKFATLLAYESSMRMGHHNVFYRDLDGLPWPGYKWTAVTELWRRLKAGHVLTIPHHLGIRWGVADVPSTGPELQEIQTGARSGRNGPVLDWSLPHDPLLRPALEIYSKHGQSEYFDPDDPLAYEQVKYTGGSSVEGAHYAQDAWAAGHLMGTVAASDNHTAQPGLMNTGLTAVYAPVLTREAIFDAILHRRTYATTGERIILDFEIAGVRIGGVGNRDGESEGRVKVVAPSEIRFAEVLKNDLSGADWKTVVRWDAPGSGLHQTFSISANAARNVYYLRVELEAKTAGRVARAWSSPIWLSPSKPLPE